MKEFISRGLYDPKYAARLIRVGSRKVHVNANTVKRWVWGYERDRKAYPGALTPEVPDLGRSRAITFLELIEVLSIAAFREAGASWNKIRATLRDVADVVPYPHPFARETWFADPGGVYYREKAGLKAGVLFEVSMGGQVAIGEALLPYLRRIDFGQDGLAERWFPFGRESPVVIDPRREFGAPTILGTSVKTEVLASLAGQGQTADEIAWWYDLTPHQVDEALRFEAAAA